MELSIGQKGDGSRSERDVLYRRERRESGESVYWGGHDALVVVLRSGRRQLREREKEGRERAIILEKRKSKPFTCFEFMRA